MALDDVVKYGKKALKAEDFSRQYAQDNSLNPTLEIAGWEGLPASDPVTYSFVRDTSPDMPLARQRQTLENYISVNASQAITEVQADVPGSVGLITKDEVLRQYVMSRKPKSYAGVDDAVLKAHKKAAGALELLQDKNALMRESNDRIAKNINGLVTKKVNAALIGAVSWLYSNNSGVVVNAVQTEASGKIEAFNNIPADALRGYVIGRYGSLGDDEKKSEAYEIAKVAARSN